MSNNLSKALLRKKFSSIKSPKKPSWIRVRIQSEKSQHVKETLSENKIVTVCEEAMCPNLDDCWSKKHATFMIMGDICTRSCSFCNVKTGKPKLIDPLEPIRIANSVFQLQLKHVVITSVDRDDLQDGGAINFVNTVNQIKLKCPETTIEVLTPDFRNKNTALKIISMCEVDVFNHNLETINRLYKNVRPGADYYHSLQILEDFKILNPKVFTKSGIMIGLGEKYDEVVELMYDLKDRDVDFLTIGQYLRPSQYHYPVIEYHTHEYFMKLYDEAIKIGFNIVSSSPFTRSSYHAEEDFNRLRELKLHAKTKRK